MNGNYLKDDIKRKCIFKWPMYSASPVCIGFKEMSHRITYTYIRYKTICTEDILPDDIGRNLMIKIKDFQNKIMLT